MLLVFKQQFSGNVESSLKLIPHWRVSSGEVTSQSETFFGAEAGLRIKNPISMVFWVLARRLHLVLLE